MKTQVFATLSSLTLLTAASAFAQSSTVLQADIPFEFHVGGTILPAGHYYVHPQIASGTTLLQCFKCKAAAVTGTIAVEARKSPEKGSLVFTRYNQTYFLSRVWTPGHSRGQELQKVKAERELARNSSPATPTTVALARH